VLSIKPFIFQEYQELKEMNGMLDKQNAKASRILGITNDILYKQGFDKIRAVYDAFMDGKSFFS
jgi:hypothetical protein